MRFTVLLALLVSAPAAARQAPDWTYCDFGIDPKAGLLATKSWLEAGKQTGIAETLYRRPDYRAAALPQPRMEAEAACAAALASPDLDAQGWSRRVSLLEARAAHRIAADRFAEALGDLEAARATIPPNLDPAERARSLDIGLALLRALALNGSGKPAEAIQLVVAAADARPWSGQIQDIAAALLRSFPGGAAGSAAIVERQFRLDATMREARARSRQAAGDFAAAAADWPLVKPSLMDPTAVRVPMPKLTGPNAGWSIKMIDPRRVGTAALAAAFAGDPASARRWISEARAAAAAKPEPLPSYLTSLGVQPVVDGLPQEAAFAKWNDLVEAAFAWQQGRKAEARTVVQKLGTVSDEPAALQAVSLILETPISAPASKRQVDARLLFAGLPTYEGGDVVDVATSENPVSNFLFGSSTPAKKPQRNSYSSGTGFFKAAGFKSKPMKDGVGTTIIFTGDASSSFAVEEMTLLRAADLAGEAGKARLLILDKRDFTRSTQMTVNGSPRGNATPAGFITELDVLFTDRADERAIPVVDIIASLAPVYRPR